MRILLPLVSSDHSSVLPWLDRSYFQFFSKNFRNLPESYSVILPCSSTAGSVFPRWRTKTKENQSTSLAWEIKYKEAKFTGKKRSGRLRIRERDERRGRGKTTLLETRCDGVSMIVECVTAFCHKLSCNFYVERIVLYIYRTIANSFVTTASRP